MSPAEIRDALESGELEGLILWDVDPVRDFADPAAWSRAIGAADFTLSVSMFGSASAQNADLHFPIETHAEKEGTVTHPDGRLQRVRPSVPRPANVAALWQVLTELAEALGDSTGFQSQADVLAAITNDVPRYAGQSNETIGGDGIRPEKAAADEGSGGSRTEAHPRPGAPAVAPEDPSSVDASPVRTTSDGLTISTTRSIWSDYVAERNPSLEYQAVAQILSLNYRDAAARDLRDGDEVTISADGAAISARVEIKSRIPAGTAFLYEGIRENSANLLPFGTVEIAKALLPDEDEPAEPVAVGVSEREEVEW